MIGALQMSGNVLFLSYSKRLLKGKMHEKKKYN